MSRRQQSCNNIFVFLVIIGFIHDSRQEYKQFSLENPKLCSPISSKKIKYEAVIVDQGRPINQHSIPWNFNSTCRFEVQSAYPKGGVIAVIQNLNLRKNENDECIDYIEFHVRNKYTRRYCGSYTADLIMREHTDSSLQSYKNSIIDAEGELDVTIFIHKKPLNLNERTELNVAFSSYKACSFSHIKHLKLSPCDKNEEICINRQYFYDGVINCPYYGCVDEELIEPANSPVSVGNTIVIGSISVLALVFALFILLMWATKKHKSCCWADDFAHPTTQENNRNSRVMEMNEQTGARLAEPSVTPGQPSAPVEEEKDLPPSYDSLFPPNSRQQKR